MYKKARQFIRFIVDETLMRLLYYIRGATRARVVDELLHRAAISSADYVEQYMGNCLVFEGATDLWDFAISKITVAGLIAEFGVWNGYSINYLAKQRSDTIYGFDSFEGLKEDWKGHSYRKGKFDRHGVLPSVRPNVVLVKGWFDETLPDFLAKNEGPFSYIHFDADTYESTAAVLKLIRNRIIKGTVIVFDDYFGYPGWMHGEHKAWQEFISSTQAAYEYIAFANWQVAVITK
jgi:predicted O-methyltransferase YrrM